MAKITTADITKLRQITGAGIMDCKKALMEADGDFEKAIEILRKKGQAITQKRADKEAKEGVVLAKAENGKAVIIALNCETDFVARTDDFINVAETILNKAYENMPESLDDLKNLKVDDTHTVQDEVVNLAGKTGEKVELSFYGKLEAESVGKYIHYDKKSSAIVGFNKPNVSEEVMANIAMQIVAMKPLSLDENDLDPEVKAKEREIIEEQVKNDEKFKNKPEQALKNIIEGKFNKMLKEKTLLNQKYIKNEKMTVKEYLSSIDKDLQITKFISYSLKA